MQSLRDKIAEVTASVMAGRKCDCAGCNCHYSAEDTSKVADAVTTAVLEYFSLADLTAAARERSANFLRRMADAVHKA